MFTLQIVTCICDSRIWLPTTPDTLVGSTNPPYPGQMVSLDPGRPQGVKYREEALLVITQFYWASAYTDYLHLDNSQMHHIASLYFDNTPQIPKC